MKVLFVFRRNKKNKDFLNHLICNQGNSIQANFPETKIDYFVIRGESFFAYITNIPRYRKLVKKGKYDVIHAHYFISGIFAAVSSSKPLVVSLMGSDLHGNKAVKYIIRFFTKWRMDWIIVKSTKMKDLLKVKNSTIIPNGINLDTFKLIDKFEARKYIGFDKDKIYGIFSSSEIPVKNFKLAKDSLSIVNDPTLNIFELNGFPHDKIKYYLNAADFLILTSLHEGSPNIIKEAMACNCPIIATDVGDVREVIKNTDHCYIVNFDANEIAEKIRIIMSNLKRSNGREIVKEIEEKIIAYRILNVYKMLVPKL